MDRPYLKKEEYIQNFAELFDKKFKYLLSKTIEKNKEFINQNDLIQEVIQHANHCRNLTKKMPDSHKMYSSLNNYLNDDQNTRPFILAGPSGSG